MNHLDMCKKTLKALGYREVESYSSSAYESMTFFEDGDEEGFRIVATRDNGNDVLIRFNPQGACLL